MMGRHLNLDLMGRGKSSRPFLNRLGDRLLARADTELLLRLANIKVDGHVLNVETLGDPGSPQPFGQPQQTLPLAVGQPDGLRQLAHKASQRPR